MRQCEIERVELGKGSEKAKRTGVKMVTLNHVLNSTIGKKCL